MRSFAIDEPRSSVRALYATLAHSKWLVVVLGASEILKDIEKYSEMFKDIQHKYSE